MFRELGMHNFVPPLLPSIASVHSNRPVSLLEVAALSLISN